MKPKKAKEFIPEIAVKLNQPEKLVEDLVMFYWQEVRRSLSSLKHCRIHLINLGDFTIKHWKLAEKITKLEKFEENNRQKGLQQMTTRFKIMENLYDLKNIRSMIDIENQRAEFIKLHKKSTYESKNKSDQDMEK